MSTSGHPPPTQTTSDITLQTITTNTGGTKETPETLADHGAASSVVSNNTDITTPVTTAIETTTSEDPQVICEPTDINMDTLTKENPDLDNSTEVSDLTQTDSSSHNDTTLLNIKPEDEEDDKCIISVESKSLTDDNFDSHDDKECIIGKFDSHDDKESIMTEERKDSFMDTLTTYVDKFDNWIEDLDQSLSWVPDLEDVPAAKWILDRLP